MVDACDDRQSAVGVVVQPLPIEEIVIAIVHIELRLERRRIGGVVELRTVVIDDIAVASGHYRHIGMAVRLATRRTRVHRAKRDDAPNGDAGQRDDFRHDDHCLAPARMAHQRQPREIDVAAENGVSAGVEGLQMGDRRDHDVGAVANVVGPASPLIGRITIDADHDDAHSCELRLQVIVAEVAGGTAVATMNQDGDRHTAQLRQSGVEGGFRAIGIGGVVNRTGDLLTVAARYGHRPPS